jgi:uncharacterized protein (DUF1800 family)
MKQHYTLRFLPFAFFLLYLSYPLSGQIPVYLDHIGAGNADGISISTSSDFYKAGRTNQATGRSSLDGNGLEGARMEASRFLAQASLGASPSEIERLATTLNFNEWIENQSRMHETVMINEVQRAFNAARNSRALTHDVSNYGNSFRHFQFAWWQSIMTNRDVLRQRIAQALSEILVISSNSTIRGDGRIYASYYDIFLRNAFGNYRDILREVSLHPAMGIYLTHFRNPKTDTLNNTFPDENYAREIMQLFTIGLFELNQDGSFRLNAQGNPIPTYDLDDTRELARVFTGLGAGALTQNAFDQGRNLNFNTREFHMNYLVPMAMYEEQHEEGEKIILGDKVIPAGQSGMEDIEMAIGYLFNHPNVGPFIGRRLIQQIVKSNPSSAYVEDVAAAFANNGDGVRGDMKAVIKAILLHEEARDCLWQQEPGNGKLRSPVSRYAVFAKAVPREYEMPFHYTDAGGFSNNTFHRVLDAPSVFNFYLPDHQPIGPLSEQNLYAPEFQIHNSVTSIGYVNEVDKWTRRAELFNTYEFPGKVEFSRAGYYEMAKDTEVLINHLDRILTFGRLSEETRQIIRDAIDGVQTNNEEQRLRQRVELATYLVMISPEFNVLK